MVENRSSRFERRSRGNCKDQGDRFLKAIDQRAAIVFALRAGKVNEVYEFQEDGAMAAEFWS